VIVIGGKSEDPEAVKPVIFGELEVPVQLNVVPALEGVHDTFVVGVPEQIVKNELQHDDLKTRLTLGDSTPLEVLTINYIHFIVKKSVLIHTTIKGIF
jgi:hypothetical protein